MFFFWDVLSVSGIVVGRWCNCFTDIGIFTSIVNISIKMIQSKLVGLVFKLKEIIFTLVL